MQPSRGAMRVRSLVVTMGGWRWLCVGRGCVWGFVVVLHDLVYLGRGHCAPHTRD